MESSNINESALKREQMIYMVVNACKGIRWERRMMIDLGASASGSQNLERETEDEALPE